ncbi:hypothetical protein [Legionella sp. km772]|uniref:hypothetical protein n=1 Tax=Legionella sp. km772 TaxID=2498111 RepID=UPI000F8CE710|nr:hypothetical protein [Legionella sp. km772]RUR07832.1 hypothetical protein ELY15_11725 [Legionella sp. km772]
MPLIKSVFSAIKEINFIQLKPEHRAIVDGYVKQIMAIQHKAHEPRCLEESLKILHEQLGVRLKSLAQMSIGFSPLKAYRRKNAIVKIEARLECLNECLSGDFAALYQKKKDEFLHFLSAAKLRHFLRPGADFLNTLYELLLNDDPLLIALLEDHLEQGVLKDEYSKQFNELILLLRLKASYKPKKNPSHFSDYSLLELEMDIEKQQALALVNGDKALGRALKYLALGCQLTTIKTTALQAAVLEHGVNMQAYRHNQKCRELGGRVVVHCNQILIPGLGLENGFCYGLSYLWAKQLIKSDKFMGFRGNQEAYIQPTSASAAIVKLIPSFNDLVRIDIELFTIQESQELTKLPNYQLIITHVTHGQF